MGRTRTTTIVRSSMLLCYLLAVSSKCGSSSNSQSTNIITPSTTTTSDCGDDDDDNRRNNNVVTTTAAADTDTGGRSALERTRQLFLSQQNSQQQQQQQGNKPAAKVKRNGEFENVDFWEEHSDLLREAWMEWYHNQNHHDHDHYRRGTSSTANNDDDRLPLPSLEFNDGRVSTASTGNNKTKTTTTKPTTTMINSTLWDRIQAVHNNPTVENENRVKELWMEHNGNGQQQQQQQVFSCSEFFSPSGIQNIRTHLDVIRELSYHTIPTRRPNGMNRNGIVLDSDHTVDGGVSYPPLDEFKNQLIDHIIRPVARALFPNYTRQPIDLLRSINNNNDDGNRHQFGFESDLSFLDHRNKQFNETNKNSTTNPNKRRFVYNDDVSYAFTVHYEGGGHLDDDDTNEDHHMNNNSGVIVDKDLAWHTDASLYTINLNLNSWDEYDEERPPQLAFDSSGSLKRTTPTSTTNVSNVTTNITSTNGQYVKDHVDHELVLNVTPGSAIIHRGLIPHTARTLGGTHLSTTNKPRQRRDQLIIWLWGYDDYGQDYQVQAIPTMPTTDRMMTVEERWRPVIVVGSDDSGGAGGTSTSTSTTEKVEKRDLHNAVYDKDHSNEEL